jgi:hypothetical protein
MKEKINEITCTTNKKCILNVLGSDAERTTRPSRWGPKGR